MLGHDWTLYPLISTCVYNSIGWNEFKKKNPEFYQRKTSLKSPLRISLINFDKKIEKKSILKAVIFYFVCFVLKICVKI